MPYFNIAFQLSIVDMQTLNTFKKIDDDTDLIIKIHTKKGIGSELTQSNSVKRNGLIPAMRHANKWFHDMMVGILKDVSSVNNIINEFKSNGL